MIIPPLIWWLVLGLLLLAALSISTAAFVESRLARVVDLSPTVTSGPFPNPTPFNLEVTEKGTFEIPQPDQNVYPANPVNTEYPLRFGNPPTLITQTSDLLMNQACPFSHPIETVSHFDTVVLSCPDLGYALPGSPSEGASDFYRVVSVLQDGDKVPALGFRGGSNYYYALAGTPQGSTWPSDPVLVFSMSSSNSGTDLILLEGRPSAFMLDTDSSLRYVHSLDNVFGSSRSYAISVTSASLDYLASVELRNGRPAFAYGSSSPDQIHYRSAAKDNPASEADWRSDFVITFTSNQSPSGGLDMALVDLTETTGPKRPAIAYGDLEGSVRILVADDDDPSNPLQWSGPWVVVSKTAVWNSVGKRLVLVNIDVGEETRPMVVWLNNDGAQNLLYFIISDMAIGTTWPGPEGRIPVFPSEDQEAFDAARLPDGTVGITFNSASLPRRQMYVRINGNDPANFKVVNLGNKEAGRNDVLGLGVVNEGPAAAWSSSGKLKYVSAEGDNLDFVNPVKVTWNATGLL